MKTTTFQDNSGNHIQVSLASDGDIRVYISENSTTQESKACLKLSEHQAYMLVGAIMDITDDDDE